jgi:hypothetical protein
MNAALLEAGLAAGPNVLAAGGTAWGGPLAYIFFFVVASVVVALVTSAVRIEDPVRIAVETQRFFLTIVAVIAAFGIVVFVLGWIFVRPPL